MIFIIIHLYHNINNNEVYHTTQNLNFTIINNIINFSTLFNLFSSQNIQHDNIKKKIEREDYMIIKKYSLNI